MLDIHNEAIQSVNSVYHEFLLRFKKSEKNIYSFVEGNDDPSFYRGFLEYVIPSDIHLFVWPTGNKDRVIQLYDSFDWSRFSKHQILFFLDRDLSELLNHALPNDTNVYITDNYSIENDIVTTNTLDRVFKELFNLYLTEDQKMRIDKLFKEQLGLFMENMILVMTWIVYWKSNKLKPCLNDISMKKLFCFSDGKLEVIKNPKGYNSVEEYIHAICNIKYDSSVNLNDISRKFIEENNHRNLIRGKYVLWFFVEFINSVYLSIRTILSLIGKIPKRHISLGHSNAIILIAPRAMIPISLKNFIENNIREYLSTI